MAATDRLFTEEDLRAMETRTLDRLVAAIDDGDMDAARANARRMFREFEAMHRLYRRWVVSLLTFVGERFGDVSLQEALHESVRTWWGPFVEAFVEGDGDLATRARRFASGLRGHLVGLSVAEDDERIIIRMDPCGSGGRLVREGVYDGADPMLTVPGPRPVTHGFDTMPVYCCHQPFMEIVSIELYGWPAIVIEPECHLERCRCAFIIYKDPADVPDRYYERLGLERSQRPR